MAEHPCAPLKATLSAYRAQIDALLAQAERAAERNGAVSAALAEHQQAYETGHWSRASEVLLPGYKAGHRRAPGVPFFMDASGATPPANADTERLRPLLAPYPGNHPAKKWSDADRGRLQAGVQRANYARLVAEGKAAAGGFGEQDAVAPGELAINVEGLDWDAIAKEHVPGRSGVECQVQWLMHDHPSISKEAWTKEDDRRLLRIVQAHKATDWEAIANEFGQGRVAHQCFSRYQRSLNPRMVRREWTEEEDAILRDAHRVYGNSWSLIAQYLPGRVAQQCLHRWDKSLKPNIRHGRWDQGEDLCLLLAVAAHGDKWTRVKRHVPGRTDAQCRERYCNVVSPELNMGPWTPSEDARLVESVGTHGQGKWKLIAGDLAPRTDNQCWRRWKVINPREVTESYSKERLKRKKALPSHFTGRDHERPDLDLDDVELGADVLAEVEATLVKRREQSIIKRQRREREQRAAQQKQPAPSREPKASAPPIEEEHERQSTRPLRARKAPSRLEL